MKVRILGAAFVLGIGAALLAPAAAEAGHRHSNHCRSRQVYVPAYPYYAPAPPPACYRYDAHGYGRERDDYRGDYYGDARYRERYYRDDDYDGGCRRDHRHDSRCGHRGYGYAPPQRAHYHGRAHCVRPHLSIRLGW